MDSELFVPLRSNAHTLVSGAPVAALRRRLKWASLFYDRIHLEAGVLQVQAGPTGSVSTISASSDLLPARWQTPASRHLASRTSFHLAIGQEDTPGVPAAELRTVISSETSISWMATLEPFRDELPGSCDWIEWVRTLDPQDEAERLARQWTSDDQRNPALEQSMPVRFVRSTVIEQTNRDLVIALSAGLAVSLDGAHTEVVRKRFSHNAGWGMSGFALPILFPQVGEDSWENIAALRRHPGAARFRQVLREVEATASEEAAGGDIEAAAHHAYQGELGAAVDRLDGLGSSARRALVGFVIGGGAGLVTSGITGPVGIAAGAALGAVPLAVVDVRNVLRVRRSRGWVAMHQALTS